MRVHVVRNVPFEGPGVIAEWATERGHALGETLAVTGAYPPASEVDLLVIMGGPMAADDEVHHPWLGAEKHYAAEVLDAGGLVLGVCLGAQLLADVIGGAVRRNGHREIGWYPVRLTASGASEPVFSAFPDGLVVGHWHGDTFELPEGVDPALSSTATPNQAYLAAGGRALGLQFHLEWTHDSLADLVAQCAEELVDGGPHVMAAGDLLEGAHHHLAIGRAALFDLLDRFTEGRS